MNRMLFEFQRGKGLMFEQQQENIAFYGKLATYQPRFKRGPRKKRMHRARPLVLVAPNRWPNNRRWHSYLRMRDRIGHKHFQGLTPKANRF